MRVIREKSGEGWELWSGPKFLGHFTSNSQAWRQADKLKGEASSREHDQAEWRTSRNDN